MKRILLLGGLAIVSVATFSFVQKNQKAVATLQADLTKSTISWIGSKPGGYHPGNFSLKSGEVQLDANNKLAGGKFVIDINSVKVTDNAGERLAGHLKTADFFDAAKWGEATYEITSVKYIDDRRANVSGTLNIKGVNVPVSFEASTNYNAEKGFMGLAYLPLSRKAIGVGAEGGAVDAVQVYIQLSAK